MFKKIWESKKTTLMFCLVLIFGVMLGVGAKILVTKAALQEIKFEQAGGVLNMQEGQITNLITPSSDDDYSVTNVNYVNSVANGTESGVGIWQSPIGDTNAYLRIDYANLGIGTTNPAEKLEVRDDEDGSISRIRITDINDNPELQLQYGNGINDHWGIYSDQGNGDSFTIWSSIYNGNVFTIDHQGKIKIGRGAGCTTCALSVDGSISASELRLSGGIEVDGDMNIAGDLIVTDAFTINGVLYADEVEGTAGQSIEFDNNGNVIITIP